MLHAEKTIICPVYAAGVGTETDIASYLFRRHCKLFRMRTIELKRALEELKVDHKGSRTGSTYSNPLLVNLFVECTTRSISAEYCETIRKPLYLRVLGKGKGRIDSRINL